MSSSGKGLGKFIWLICGKSLGQSTLMRLVVISGVIATGKHLGPVFPLWGFGAGVRSTSRGPRTRPLTKALDHTLSTLPSLFSPHPTPMKSLSFSPSSPLPLGTSWGLTKCQSYGFSAIWGVFHVLAAAPSVAHSPSSRYEDVGSASRTLSLWIPARLEETHPITLVQRPE